MRCVIAFHGCLSRQTALDTSSSHPCTDLHDLVTLHGSSTVFMPRHDMWRRIKSTSLFLIFRHGRSHFPQFPSFNRKLARRNNATPLYLTFHKMTSTWRNNCGSLETAEAFATKEMENVSSDVKGAARSFMDARKLVAQVRSARRFFPVLGVGAFDGLQSITPRVSAGKNGFGKGKGLTSPSKSRGRGKGKGKSKPDARRPSPAKPRQTSNGPMRG